MWNRRVGVLARGILMVTGLAAAISLPACSRGTKGQITGALILSMSEEVTIGVCYDPGASFPQRIDPVTSFTITIDALRLFGVPGPLTLYGEVSSASSETQIAFDGAPVVANDTGPDIIATPPREMSSVVVAYEFQRATDVVSIVEVEFRLADGTGRTVDAGVFSLRVEPTSCARPRGGGVVFSNTPPIDAAETDAEIWTIDLATRVAAPLTTNQGISDRNPAWSPDRSEIAFVSNRVDPGRSDFHLVVMNADGSQQTPVIEIPEGWSAADPAWSPVAGERRIAFSLGETGFGSDIWILDLDQPEGVRLHELTISGDRDRSVAWSPDGKRIAFSRSDGIYVAPGRWTGTFPPPAAERIFEGVSVGGLDWSASGIVFHQYSFATNHIRIARIDDTGGNLIEIDSGGSHLSDMTPAWSPTSDYIVFVRRPAPPPAPPSPQELGSGDDRLRTLASSAPANTDGEDVTGQPEGDNHDPDW